MIEILLWTVPALIAAAVLGLWLLAKRRASARRAKAPLSLPKTKPAAPSPARRQPARKEASEALRERRAESVNYADEYDDVLDLEPGMEANVHQERTAAPGASIDRAVAPGVLVENAPRVMTTGVPVQVEARISRKDLPKLTAGMEGDVRKHAIQTTKAMTVTLQAPLGAFSIQSHSRETQFIDSGHLQKLGLIANEFGSWKWTVTPLARGNHKLNIVIAARARDETGTEAEALLPEQIVPVEVQINYYANAKQFAVWLGVAAAGAIVSHYAPKLLDALTG
jgi:hypothetical protein